jgi:hypothetical protein
MTDQARLRKAIRSLESLRGQFAGNGVVERALVNVYERARIEIEEETGEDFTHLSAANLGTRGTRSVFISALYPAIDQILLTIQPEPVSAVASAGDDNRRGDYGAQPTFRTDLLRERCAPILQGPGPFDIAVNQATLVLEFSLRDKASYTGPEVGAKLVSAVLNGANPPIRISSDAGEQEGFAHLCRGIMQFYRNPTHHDIRSVNREEALAVCLLIDQLIMKFDLGLTEEELEIILADLDADVSAYTDEELASIKAMLEE